YDEVTAGPWTVPAVTVVDSPRFAYRGIMLDVARSFQTVDEVKQFIDSLVQLKMNHLHLHLADDQGWRIEITNEGRAEGDDIDYTRLTSVSGQTAMTEQGYEDEPGRTGFYTQEDYRSEEHTSELQSRENLVCRLLLEKKKKNKQNEKIDSYV